jgi:hypothetical protein
VGFEDVDYADMFTFDDGNRRGHSMKLNKRFAKNKGQYTCSNRVHGMTYLKLKVACNTLNPFKASCISCNDMM